MTNESERLRLWIRTLRSLYFSCLSSELRQSREFRFQHKAQKVKSSPFRLHTDGTSSLNGIVSTKAKPPRPVIPVQTTLYPTTSVSSVGSLKNGAASRRLSDLWHSGALCGLYSTRNLITCSNAALLWLIPDRDLLSANPLCRIRVGS